LSAFGFEVESPIHGEIAGAVDTLVGVANVFQGDDSKSATDGLGKAEFNGAGGRNGGFDFLHPIDLFEFALGLGGFAGFGAETVSELLEGGNLLLLVFERS
jgi:hypothetical protein